MEFSFTYLSPGGVSGAHNFVLVTIVLITRCVYVRANLCEKIRNHGYLIFQIYSFLEMGVVSFWALLLCDFFFFPFSSYFLHFTSG